MYCMERLPYYMVDKMRIGSWKNILNGLVTVTYIQSSRKFKRHSTNSKFTDTDRYILPCTTLIFAKLSIIPHILRFQFQFLRLAVDE